MEATACLRPRQTQCPAGEREAEELSPLGTAAEAESGDCTAAAEAAAEAAMRRATVAPEAREARAQWWLLLISKA